MAGRKARGPWMRSTEMSLESHRWRGAIEVRLLRYVLALQMSWKNFTNLWLTKFYNLTMYVPHPLLSLCWRNLPTACPTSVLRECNAVISVQSCTEVERRGGALLWLIAGYVVVVMLQCQVPQAAVYVDDQAGGLWVELNTSMKALNILS